MLHAALRLEGIVKRFAGVTALDGVGFDIASGEVHALVGENGAGKSTLVKIITGAYRRDAGTISLHGKPGDFGTPAAAQAAGIVAVHQEIHLLPHRTVAENVFLSREPRRGKGAWAIVDWGRMFADTSTLFEQLGMDINPRAELRTLRTAQQQMVAIARSVSLGAKVLLLDEPTSSLSDREVTLLFDVIRALKASGTAILYISHRFDELYRICDTVTVLRDGHCVATRPLAGLDRLDLVCLMLGREREELAASETASPVNTAGDSNETPLLRATELKCGTRLRGVSLDVQRGETVGLAGLLGAGRSETARALFGAEPLDGGAITIRGVPYSPRTPRDAIAARIAFLPEDRKLEGIIPDLSVRENITLAALPTLTRFGIVSRARQRTIVDKYMRRLGIKAKSADQPIRELSGGNQQKVLIARWLCTHPELLITDEPTRGIDVGAHREIQSLIAELAASGLGILMISSDVDELAEGSDRVVVLHDGWSIATLERDAGVASLRDSIIYALAKDNLPAQQAVS